MITVAVYFGTDEEFSEMDMNDIDSFVELIKKHGYNNSDDEKHYQFYDAHFVGSNFFAIELEEE